MLILHRRVGQRIVLTGGIEITVTEVSRGGVRLAVTAPRGIAVVRGEVHDAIVAANEAAVASAIGMGVGAVDAGAAPGDGRTNGADEARVGSGETPTTEPPHSHEAE